MSELRLFLVELGLPVSGLKGEQVQRILQFLLYPLDSSKVGGALCHDSRLGWQAYISYIPSPVHSQAQ